MPISLAKVKWKLLSEVLLIIDIPVRCLSAISRDVRNNAFSKPVLKGELQTGDLNEASLTELNWDFLTGSQPVKNKIRIILGYNKLRIWNILV